MCWLQYSAGKIWSVETGRRTSYPSHHISRPQIAPKASHAHTVGARYSICSICFQSIEKIKGSSWWNLGNYFRSTYLMNERCDSSKMTEMVKRLTSFTPYLNSSRLVDFDYYSSQSLQYKTDMKLKQSWTDWRYSRKAANKFESKIRWI